VTFCILRLRDADEYLQISITHRRLHSLRQIFGKAQSVHHHLIMGAGGSRNYKSHAQREQDRINQAERARVRKQLKRQEQKREKAEYEARETWLRIYRAEDMGQKKWWNSEWWPLLSWFKERRAWKKEKERRRRMGWSESDGIMLRPHKD
jgi:hypothetical protein